MNTSELVNQIIADKISGMETITNYQKKPKRITVDSEDFVLELNNNFMILNTRKMPAVDSIKMVSSNNIFEFTPDDYEWMDEFRYQCFFDYIEITTKSSGVFAPYTLELIEVVPHR